MNINTINSSRNFTEKLSMETISPPSDQKNSEPTQTIQAIQKIQKSDGNSRLNEEEKDTLSLKEKQTLVDEINEYMDDLQTDLGFSIHEKLDHQVVIQVKNRNTEEIITQIPSEELIGIKVKMEELAGLIFDARV